MSIRIKEFEQALRTINLSENSVNQCYEAIINNRSISDIAKEFNVSRQAVGQKVQQMKNIIAKQKQGLLSETLTLEVEREIFDAVVSMINERVKNNDR